MVFHFSLLNFNLKKPLSSKEAFWLYIVVLIVISFFSLANAQTSDEKKQSLQTQIEALEKEAEGINQNIDKTKQEADTLKNEISIFNNEIKRKELEIKKLTLAIQQADLEINEKNKKIAEISNRIKNHKKMLASSLLILNDYEGQGIFSILIRNKTLSAFLLAIDDLFSIQKTVKGIIVNLRSEDEELKKEKEELEDFQTSQANLKSLQEIERRSVTQKKQERDNILKLTQGKEALFQKLLQNKKKNIAALRTQLFYLEKTGVPAEDALKFADLAAKRAGIRPAFLLAILEVETGKQFEDGVISVGTNLGTGNWKKDMYDCYIRLGRRSAAESQKRAFFAITDKLGFDPDKMPVSRRPSYGCGGAMGPAQFIPTTWLLYEDKVAALTGHNPLNPWNMKDAFTASAIFLAEGGATSQTKVGELRAARIYISGRATCSTTTSSGRACNYYANRVFSLSQDIDRVI